MKRKTMTKHEARDEAIERAYQRLLDNLGSCVACLEDLGENDMGLLHHSLARDFHSATSKLRKLLDRLEGKHDTDTRARSA
jgi:hypothetical protein